jgi:hypothetical protein
MAAGIAARGSCGSAGRSSSSKRHPPPFKPRRRCPPRCAHPHPHTGGRGAGTGGPYQHARSALWPPGPTDLGHPRSHRPAHLRYGRAGCAPAYR